MLQQVVHQQAHHLELVDEHAALVGRARAVRVAVQQQAQVVAALRQDAQRLVDVRRDRLGVDATEPRVALLWISVTWILPPASSRGIQPAPEPHIGSTSTRMSAAFSGSRSSDRLT